MSIDVLGAKLVDAGRVPGATPGTALTSELILYEDGRTETGIREVTPGVFDAPASRSRSPRAGEGAGRSVRRCARRT